MQGVASLLEAELYLSRPSEPIYFPLKKSL